MLAVLRELELAVLVVSGTNKLSVTFVKILLLDDVNEATSNVDFGCLDVFSVSLLYEEDGLMDCT